MESDHFFFGIPFFLGFKSGGLVLFRLVFDIVLVYFVRYYGLYILLRRICMDVFV